MTKLLLTIEELSELLSLSRSKIIAMEKRGELPKPTNLGGNTRWKTAEIETWVSQLPPAPPQTTPKRGRRRMAT